MNTTMLIKLFILSLFTCVYGITPVITNEPKDYLGLQDLENKKLFFQRGKKLVRLPNSLCIEINKSFVGDVKDLRNQKALMWLKFKLDCENSVNSAFSFEIKNGKTLLLTSMDTKILKIYKEEKDTFSFVSDNFLIKIHIWNGFNDRHGIVRFVLFDIKNQMFINSSSPLKSINTKADL